LINIIERNELLNLDLKSIFDLSDRHFAFVSGFYLHYSGIVGGKADCIYPFYSPNRRFSLTEEMMTLLYTQIAFLGKFGVDLPPPTDPLKSMYVEFQTRIRPVLNDVLPRLPDNHVSLFHICLPHGPYLFNRDWTPRANPGSMVSTNVADYLENVYAMDAVIGDIIQCLKTRGDFDSSLIVFFADHSWREKFSRPEAEMDLDQFAPEKHVPLIIKYPRQSRGGESSLPILLTELHPLFEAFLTNPAQVIRWSSEWNAGKDLPPLLGPP